MILNVDYSANWGGGSINYEGSEAVALRMLEAMAQRIREAMEAQRVQD